MQRSERSKQRVNNGAGASAAGLDWGMGSGVISPKEPDVTYFISLLNQLTCLKRFREIGGAV